MTDLANKIEQATAPPPKESSVAGLVKSMQPQFALALPSMIDAERFTRICLTTVRSNPALGDCDPTSLLGALMLCAQLGLEPGPLGHAYLVPFKSRKTGKVECTFIPGYRGLVDLARRSGQVGSIYAEPVFEGDQFSWQLGLHRDITHVPDAVNRDDPKKITHVYAVAQLKGSDDPEFTVMTRAQVERVRASSKAKDSGPWVDWWDQMALKTVVKRLTKLLPLSAEVQRSMSIDEVTPATPYNIDLDVLAADSIEANAIESGEPAKPPGTSEEEKP